MRPTPRRAENAAAKLLTEFFETIGASPVERVPVTGRTGPDISVNELKLVVDVKSRRGVPASMLSGKDEVIFTDELVGFRISDVGNHETLRRRRTSQSRMVKQWLNHMDEWTQEKCPDGISALVIRRPGMDAKNSTVIIYLSKEQAWITRVQHFKQQGAASSVS